MASSVFLIVFGAVNLAAFRTATHLTRKIVAIGGAAGCLVALVLVVVDTIDRSPMAVGVLGGMLVASLAGEALWFHHRRELKLSADR